MIERRSKSRVVVVDETGSLLLFRTRMDRPGEPVLWLTPGGHAEPGESSIATALRELEEETGLTGRNLTALPIVLDYRGALADGTPIDYHEEWFLLRTPRFTPDPAGWTEDERSDILEHRWWPLVDLAMTVEAVDPSTMIWLIFDHLDPRDLGEIAASVRREEDELRVPSFDQDDAWRLGLLAADLVGERPEPLAVEIAIGEHTVFKTARGGVSVLTDPWLAGKAAAVRRFDESSLSTGLSLRQDGQPVPVTGFEDGDPRAHGGSFPIRSTNGELLGTITVSGGHQLVDHAIAVAALRAFRAPID
jgi:uncharacterized protein (UPF0303 family)/ADP-ribose pyrophosphatase YjhB (NUDIX family)